MSGRQTERAGGERKRDKRDDQVMQPGDLMQQQQQPTAERATEVGRSTSSGKVRGGRCW